MSSACNLCPYNQCAAKKTTPSTPTTRTIAIKSRILRQMLLMIFSLQQPPPSRRQGIRFKRACTCSKTVLLRYCFCRMLPASFRWHDCRGRSAQPTNAIAGNADVNQRIRDQTDMADSLLNYRQAEYSPPCVSIALCTSLSGSPDIGCLLTLGTLSHVKRNFLTFLE